ncbi:hypothetical protein CHS0354_002075 [Potamilus streckersoni]|uniref:N-acetylmuramoyl-L-alanine amidase n=1 Tax=Potamilus streckersoni TaxID=2493646 RepID=A0AAE0T5S7_9BIVA|nr:hypothetical protein CHS0354_002075 [Potamilus streckersoni]
MIKLSEPVIERKYLSPNREGGLTPEFVVIHYTALEEEETLARFCRKETKVSAHFVINRAGRIYETVTCTQGLPEIAWHAGLSHYDSADGNRYEGFNHMAIGIELINLNGNLFEYTNAQYTALESLIRYLRTLYPAIGDPERIVGHEHIAGFRGKCDPGILFDWVRLYRGVFGNAVFPERRSVISSELLKLLIPFKAMIEQHPALAAALSSLADHAPNTLLKHDVQYSNKEYIRILEDSNHRIAGYLLGSALMILTVGLLLLVSLFRFEYVAGGISAGNILWYAAPAGGLFLIGLLLLSVWREYQRLKHLALLKSENRTYLLRADADRIKILLKTAQKIMDYRKPAGLNTGSSQEVLAKQTANFSGRWDVKYCKNCTGVMEMDDEDCGACGYKHPPVMMN